MGNVCQKSMKKRVGPKSDDHHMNDDKSCHVFPTNNIIFQTSPNSKCSDSDCASDFSMCIYPPTIYAGRMSIPRSMSKDTDADWVSPSPPPSFHRLSNLERKST